MSTRKRRWGAILLTVCMALSLMTTGAHAAGEELLADFSAHEVNVEDPYPEGVTVDLFDYWLTERDAVDVNKGNGKEVESKGINQNHALKFRVDNTEVNHEINQWTKSSAPNTGIVNKQLGSDGYPKLNQKKTGREESLGYLFNGENSEYKEAFMNVGGLLQRDEKGYYYYNCQENFASFNEETENFVLYQKGGINPGGGSKGFQFFPFNSVEDAFEIEGDELKQKNINSKNEVINHYFGLRMVTRFVQPKDGKSPLSGEDVTYTFSGDDDVWIFIDGVLVADLGGIHNTASVKIDFCTGEIIINEGEKNANGGYKKTTLKETFEEADQTWEYGESNTFADNTFHTLHFFYLERGNSDSNMSLKFNLMTILESEIKKVNQDYVEEDVLEGVAGAKFELYPAKNGTDWQIKDGYEKQPYATGTTDASGEFILRGQNNMPILPSDLKEESDYWVLVETEVPEGYRGVGEVHFHLSQNDGQYPLLLSDSTWDVGAYAMSKVLVTAETNGKEDDNATRTVPIAGNEDKTVTVFQDGKPVGTMFAVIMKRTGEDKNKEWDNLTLDDLSAVSGSPEKGWMVQEPGKEGVLKAAQENWYPFELGTTFTCAIDNLPGDIEKYYLVAKDGEKEKAEYTGAFFYTEEKISSKEDLESLKADDITMLNPENFERQFAMKLYVPNIQNRLLVQKTDEGGSLWMGRSSLCMNKRVSQLMKRVIM